LEEIKGMNYIMKIDRCLLMLVGVVAAIGGLGNRVLAQSLIVPDESLGEERSVIFALDADGFPVDAILGGAQRGQNLFHSFKEFNVSQGRGSYFVNTDNNVQNILARITGHNHSQISGTLGILNIEGITSTPNLFLINPNGIIFGPEASLDVGGSFVATTANAVQLGDTGSFSVSDPIASKLLSINPSVFLFNAIANQAAIINRSTSSSTTLGVAFNGESVRPVRGLQVLMGKSLVLLGGDIVLDQPPEYDPLKSAFGGEINAFGGRVELGGLGSEGSVGINIDGNKLSLVFPNNVRKANVSLSNGARVDVSAGNGGSIAINAQRLDKGLALLTVKLEILFSIL
jgi:filamentous hemagglutinin family protein